jgi:hypothetical protein
MRDYANVAQLVCLSNLESLNALLIHDGLTQSDRLQKLNRSAIQQMKILTEDLRLKEFAKQESRGKITPAASNTDSSASQ